MHAAGERETSDIGHTRVGVLNLIARITEAEREGWLGEVEGLTLSLAGANDKITQIDRSPVNSTTVDLGLPTIRNEQN